MSEEETKPMDNEEETHHNLPLIQTFVALAVLTIIEVGVGFIPSSPLITTGLVLLALVKAVLVASVFMEIAYNKETTRIVLTVFVVPFIAVLFLVLIIGSDWRNVLQI